MQMKNQRQKILCKATRPVVLKIFFTFLSYKPKLCQILPSKDHKWQLQKFHSTYCDSVLKTSTCKYY